MMKRSYLFPFVAVLGLSLAYCSDEPMPTEIERTSQDAADTPHFAISDAAHLGTAGFYFLPPVVPDPGATGTFDASFLPFTTVRICELGLTGCLTPALVEYTSTSGSGSETLRVTTDEELYTVNWHTDEFDLDPEKVYRIEVQVGPTVIGYADVDPVTSGGELKNVDTDEYIALKDGRTLPVKFRLESDLPEIEVIGPAGGTVKSGDGAVRLEFPPGAVGTATAITIVSEEDAPAEQGTIPGALWTFGPDGIVFDEPVQLTLKYDPNVLPAGITDPAAALTLGTRVAGLWEELPSSVDEDLREVTASLAGFSSYALLLKVHTIEIEPWPATLVEGSSEVLTAIPQTASGELLTARWLVWGSSDSSIVNLDAESDGLPHTVLATGAALGEATIGVVGVVRGCPPSPFGGACEVAKRFANVTVVPLNIPPIAAFTFECTDLGCDFADTSTDEDGTIESWEWDFGDGSEKSYTQNPSHLYTSDGAFSVTLTVTDDDDDTHSLSRDVIWNPANLPPVPAFRHGCTKPTTRQYFCGFIYDSYDPDGSIVEHQWIIPGYNYDPCLGQTVDCENLAISFPPDVAPTTATLIVIDDTGFTTSITRNLTEGSSFGHFWVWPSDFGVDPPGWHPFDVGNNTYYPDDGVEISLSLGQSALGVGSPIGGTVSYNGQECDVSGSVTQYWPGACQSFDSSVGLVSANVGGCQFGSITFETLQLNTCGFQEVTAYFIDSAGDAVAEGKLRQAGY
jgi:PKD repeat protein